MERWDIPPYVVLWEATKKCNLRCIHCSVECGEVSPRDMSKDDIKGVIDELSNLGCVLFIITGGEPLLREDLFEVVRYASKSMDVSLTTNGTMVKERMKELREIEWNNIQVSLDGLERFHNYFRVSNSYAEVIEAIAFLLENSISTSVATTVTDENIDQLPSMLKLLLDLGVPQWKLSAIIPVGRAKKNKLSLSLENRIKVIEFVSDVRIEHNKISVSVDDGFGYCGYLEPLVRAYPFKKCPAGISTCGIQNDGRLKACLDQPVTYPSVLTSSFTELWEDPHTFAEFRWFEPKKLKGKCGSCETVFRCFGGCKAQLLGITNNLYAENPYCVYKIIEDKQKPKKSGIFGKVATMALLLAASLTPLGTALPIDESPPPITRALLSSPECVGISTCRAFFDNYVSVDSLNISKKDKAMEIEAVIRSSFCGMVCNVSALKVDFYVDGNFVGSKIINVSGEERVSLQIPELSEGSHEIEVNLPIPPPNDSPRDNGLSERVIVFRKEQIGNESYNVSATPVIKVRDEDSKVILSFIAGAGLASIVYGIYELRRRKKV